MTSFTIRRRDISDTTPRWNGTELDRSTLIGEGPEIRTRGRNRARLELHEIGNAFVLVSRPMGPGGIWNGPPTVTEIEPVQAINAFLEWNAPESIRDAVMTALCGDVHVRSIKGRQPVIELRGALAQAVRSMAQVRGVTVESGLWDLLRNAE